jgi:hypothetical protein
MISSLENITLKTRTWQSLDSFHATMDFFIGIDSDGCVFDSMEIKHKECFCPNFIRHFNLQPVSRYAREVWEFVNLYSQWRGVNRFFALQEAFALLGERPEVNARNIQRIDDGPLKAWTDTHSRLSSVTISGYIDANPCLRSVPVAVQGMEHGCRCRRSGMGQEYSAFPPVC